MSTTILHVNTERSWRGGEVQTILLARGLKSRGHRCIIAGQPGSPLLDRAAGAGIQTAPIRMWGELDVGASRRIAGLLREERVDLLHYHTAHAVTLGSVATLFAGRRAAVAARRVSFPLRSRIMGRIKYRFRIDRVVAVTGAIRKQLIDQGLEPERIVVVHSGIDPDRFAGGDRDRFRRSLGYATTGNDKSPILVGTVGYLSSHKGIDLFLEAAALTAREIQEARFVIVGRGEQETELRQLASRLGIGGRVVFAGFREDMPDVYAGLDQFVLASSSEGSPAVVKEAMAAGVPIVATALDGVGEIAEDGRHALLTPPRNAPAMARAMTLLAKDAGLAARLVEAARVRVREFSADRMVERTEEIYRTLGVVS